MALLNSGKVLLFSGDDARIWNWNRGASSIWDPGRPTQETRPALKRNLFCCGHCYLPDGRLLVAGGQSTVHHVLTIIPSFFGILQLFTKGADHDIHTFDPQKEEWQRHEGMPKARWYPTCVTLPDGRALIVSGAWSQLHNTISGGRFINLDYEIFDPQKNMLSASKRFLNKITMYPFLQVLPGGTLFVHYENTTRLWDIDRERAYPKVFKTNTAGTRTYPGMGSCVLLPLMPGDLKARILLVGGSTSLNPNQETPATDQTEIFEFNPADPEGSLGWQLSEKTSKIRFLTDSLILPDGTIMVTSGAARGESDHNHDPVREIELFDPLEPDPGKKKWRVIGSIQKDRLYHCTAVLLPDGRVVVAGSIGHKWPPPPEANEKAIEIVEPPYMKIAGSSRPAVEGVPAEILYDSNFEIKTATQADEVASIALLRLSSTTHNNNMDQRYIGLAVISRRGNNVLEIKSPKDSSFAPPGYYMLFLLDHNRIPSVGKIIRLG
jgi:hypothetical protein